MRAQAHNIVVEPTGDTSEYEHANLIVKRQVSAEHATRRGVVIDIGAHVAEMHPDLERGAVLFYSSYYEVMDWHVVPLTGFLCYETSMETTS